MISYDTVLLLELRSVPMIFSAVADAVEWITLKSRFHP